MSSLLLKAKYVVSHTLLIISLFMPCSPGYVVAGEAQNSDSKQIVLAFLNYYKSLKKRFNDPGSNHPVILLLNEESYFLNGLTFSGRSVIVMHEFDLIDQQIATFAHLSELVIHGNNAKMRYEIPAGARFGFMKFKRQGSDWVITGNHKFRSSSGSRVFYGKLYEYVECRDFSEMAYRWGYYQSIAGTPNTGACQGDEFPDVESYRSFVQMEERERIRRENKMKGMRAVKKKMPR